MDHAGVPNLDLLALGHLMISMLVQPIGLELALIPQQTQPRPCVLGIHEHFAA